mmetsp:Transcript_25776/g.56883  ORF Transcript_25776/g.56883 Transcript_25776/m.56883 type:complete len:253 (+) Transcript_25776:94-852(+)
MLRRSCSLPGRLIAHVALPFALLEALAANLRRPSFGELWQIESPIAGGSKVTAASAQFPENPPSNCVTIGHEGEDVPHLRHPLHCHKEKDNEGSAEKGLAIDHHQGAEHGRDQKGKCRQSALGPDFAALLRWPREEEGRGHHREVPQGPHAGKPARMSDENARGGAEAAELQQLAHGNTAGATKKSLRERQLRAAGARYVGILLAAKELRGDSPQELPLRPRSAVYEAGEARLWLCLRARLCLTGTEEARQG